MPPFPAMRIALVTLASVAVASVAAGCGSGGGGTTTNATESWANGVCAAITDYSTALKGAGAKLKSNPSKAGLHEASSSVTTATKGFTSTISSLSPPQTSAGASAKQTLGGLSSSLQEDAAKIREATSGSGTIASAVATVSTTFVNAKGQVSSAVDQLKTLNAKGELKNAFSQADSCSSVPGL